MMELSELNSSSNSILLTSQSNNHNYSTYLNNLKSSSINSRPVKVNENFLRLDKIKINDYGMLKEKDKENKNKKYIYDIDMEIDTDLNSNF